MDLFFEFLAMLLGFIGLLASFAGGVIAVLGAVIAYTNIEETIIDLVDLTTMSSFINVTIGAVILVVGILLMALSSVMRKRIGRVK
jgi:hypothetical protein